MLTIHHLGISQSERIVWLCEELELAYELKHYERDPVTRLSPPALLALHPLGAAPVITDGDLVLAESGAIMEYIIASMAAAVLPLARPSRFCAIPLWFHFANGNLQPNMGRNMVLRRLNLAPDNPVLLAMRGRLDRVLDLSEKRLGEADYFAGSEFTAAYIIMVFSLTTMRVFLPIDLAPYPNMLRYLRRIGAREAYQRAMRKGDPGMKPLLT
jgi:glutathione S-transferase